FLKPFSADSIPPLPLVRPARILLRREHPVEAAGFDDLRRDWGRDVLVELSRLGLRDRPLGQSPHDELARGPLAHRDRDAVAGADLPMRLGPGSVDGHLASFTRRLGAGAGGEKARHVEPDVQADRGERRAFPGPFPHWTSVSAEGATDSGA